MFLTSEYLINMVGILVRSEPVDYILYILQKIVLNSKFEKSSSINRLSIMPCLPSRLHHYSATAHVTAYPDPVPNSNPNLDHAMVTLPRVTFT